MSEEELPASPEYGFGGAAYARARKLKQREMQAQAWHDANVAPIGRIFPADKDDEIANAREVLSAYDQLVDTLRARVAKLEAALKNARGWVRAFNSAEVVHQGDMLRQIDAALKAAPQ